MRSAKHGRSCSGQPTSLCIRIEEKALRAGLRGYDDYAARVRYRRIPLVW